MFALGQGREVGVLKALIKDAILDGEIPNDRDKAYTFLVNKANEMGLSLVE